MVGAKSADIYRATVTGTASSGLCLLSDGGPEISALSIILYHPYFTVLELTLDDT